MTREMSAARFKAKCVAVIDQVARSGRPFVITKRGKPVVKLVPTSAGEDEIFGALASIARLTGDIENISRAREWGVD